MKKECMTIINKKKARLVNDETYMRNHNQSTIIYPTSDKVLQYRLVDENRREKKEEKK